MATFKAVVRTSKEKDSKKRKILISVVHNRKTRYIPTGFNIIPDLFDNITGTPKEKYENARYLRLELQRIINNYEEFIINKIGNRVINMDCTQLVKELESINTKKHDFFSFAEKIMNDFKKNGQLRTYQIYFDAVKKLKEFSKKDHLEFTDINFGYLTTFENHLKQEGLSINTIGLHLREIRSIFNKAIDFEIIEQNIYPFRRFEIKETSTLKRNVSIETIQKIKNAKFDNPNWNIAKDVFMLMFYLIGINIKDLFYLEKNSIESDRLYYIRYKTTKNYSILLGPEAKELIEKYKGENKLFWFFDQYPKYTYMNAFLNYNLSKICKKLEIPEITTYYARHSWATIAYKLGATKYEISLALGHGAKTVTDVYIDYNSDIVDKLNHKVITAIRGESHLLPSPISQLHLSVMGYQGN